MICVDASCSKNPGPFSYRGVDTETRQEIFSFSFEHGTNNIGEFLGLVHALAYCKEKGLTTDIYSDSVTALAWVRDMKCKTSLLPHPDPEVEKVFKELISRAENFLKYKRPPNRVMKWDTVKLGEIPADYGRKGGKKKK